MKSKAVKNCLLYGLQLQDLGFGSLKQSTLKRRAVIIQPTPIAVERMAYRWISRTMALMRGGTREHFSVMAAALKKIRGAQDTRNASGKCLISIPVLPKHSSALRSLRSARPPSSLQRSLAMRSSPMSALVWSTRKHESNA